MTGLDPLKRADSFGVCYPTMVVCVCWQMEALWCFVGLLDMIALHSVFGLNRKHRSRGHGHSSGPSHSRCVVSYSPRPELQNTDMKGRGFDLEEIQKCKCCKAVNEMHWRNINSSRRRNCFHNDRPRGFNSTCWQTNTVLFVNEKRKRTRIVWPFYVNRGAKREWEHLIANKVARVTHCLRACGINKPLNVQRPHKTTENCSTNGLSTQQRAHFSGRSNAAEKAQ